MENGTITLFSPANYAFGIWGPINILTGMYVIYQVLPDAWVPDRNNAMLYGNGLGYLFMINSFF